MGIALNLNSGTAYQAQKVYVSSMLAIMGRLLQAGSEVDEVIREEIRDLPENLIFAMEVMPGNLKMVMQREGDSLKLLDNDTAPPADLRIIFKHLTHAFLVLSFQEKTSQAFANDRMIVDGNLALAMKMTRCLNRLEAVALPKLVAERAVKRYPSIQMVEKLSVALKINKTFVLNLFKS